MPLPETIVQAEVDETVHEAMHGLDHDEAAVRRSARGAGQLREEFDADARSDAEKAVKTQLLMDAIADDLDIQVGQNELTERLVLMSRQYGIEPQQLIQLLQQNNQLPAHVRRRAPRPDASPRSSRPPPSPTPPATSIDTTEFFGSSDTEDDWPRRWPPSPPRSMRTATSTTTSTATSTTMTRTTTMTTTTDDDDEADAEDADDQVTPRRPGEITPIANAHVLASARRRGLVSVGDNTYEKAGNPS